MREKDRRKAERLRARKIKQATAQTVKPSTTTTTTTATTTGDNDNTGDEKERESKEESTDNLTEGNPDNDPFEPALDSSSESDTNTNNSDDDDDNDLNGREIEDASFSEITFTREMDELSPHFLHASCAQVQMEDKTTSGGGNKTTSSTSIGISPGDSVGRSSLFDISGEEITLHIVRFKTIDTTITTLKTTPPHIPITSYTKLITSSTSSQLDPQIISSFPSPLPVGDIGTFTYLNRSVGTTVKIPCVKDPRGDPLLWPAETLTTSKIIVLHISEWKLSGCLISCYGGNLYNQTTDVHYPSEKHCTMGVESISLTVTKEMSHSFVKMNSDTSKHEEHQQAQAQAKVQKTHTTVATTTATTGEVISPVNNNFSPYPIWSPVATFDVETGEGQSPHTNQHVHIIQPKKYTIHPTEFVLNLLFPISPCLSFCLYQMCEARLFVHLFIMFHRIDLSLSLHPKSQFRPFFFFSVMLLDC